MSISGIPPVAQLSQEAADWIVDVLGIEAKERTYRAAEDACLDAHAKAGIIRQ